jgi:hypothetical protein
MPFGGGHLAGPVASGPPGKPFDAVRSSRAEVGERMTKLSPQVAAALALTLSLALACTLVPAGRARAQTQEDEVARLREEVSDLSDDLNATRAELRSAEEDRDAYAQRLEDSTSVLITALILMCASWIIFWISARRQTAMLRALRAEVGAAVEKRPPRRRG